MISRSGWSTVPKGREDLVPGRIGVCPAERGPSARRPEAPRTEETGCASPLLPEQILPYWTLRDHLVCLLIFKEENFKSVCLIFECC